MEETARELLREIRGKRSQEAFSRRLGYTSNPVADWEAGRRFPTASETLRACSLAMIDVGGSFSKFATQDCPPPETFDDAGLAAWLDVLRGRRSVAWIGTAVGRSRSRVSRWLSGQTRPRLPDFLRLVDALTGRLEDLVAALVDVEAVPSLASRWRRKQLEREVALTHPWTEAMLRLLETTTYQRLKRHPPGWLAERLHISLQEEQESLDKLVAAGILAFRGRYHTLRPLTVDSGSDPEAIWAMKAHWARASVDRLPRRGPADLYSYNIVSLSRADLERLRSLHLQYFKDVRTLVANSEPVEVAAMVLTQIVMFEPEPSR